MDAQPEAHHHRQAAAEAAVRQPQVPPVQQQQQPRPAQNSRDGNQAQHAAAMQTAFQRSQASSYAQWDLWAGISLSVLLLLALPSSIQRQHWRTQLAAFVAEVTFRVLPAWLATLATASYLPHRTPIVAACRLASVLVPRLVVQPPLPIGAWGGWAQYLLFTRALGVNTLPWLARLPFKWFVWVHLIGVADAARASLTSVCASPAFAGAVAQRHYGMLARAARLVAMLSPLPTPRGALDRPSCLDAVAAAPGDLLDPAAGTCACRQMALWLLACLGYAFPLACQFLAEAAARRRFYRQHCRRPGCAACAASKGTDLPLLSTWAALMLLGFCAVSWQLAGSLFVAQVGGGAGTCGGRLAGRGAGGACPAAL